MTYTPPGNIRAIQEIQWGATGQQLVFRPQVDGRAVTITGSASVSLYRPGALPPGSSAFSGPTSVAQSSGVCTLPVDASNTTTWTLWWDYTAIWTFTADGRTLAQPMLFDVVRELLLPFCPVNLEDLKGFDSQVDYVLTQASQTTDGVDRYIHPAWWDVMNLVRANGNRRPALVADAVCLYPATRFRALWYLAMGVHDAPDDRYRQLANELDRQFKNAWANTKLKYREADGTYVNTENAFHQPWLGASPEYPTEPVRRRLIPKWTYRP